MKYSVAIVAAIAAFANAQSACEASAEAIPACALGPIASYAAASYSCGLVDFQCQCSNSASIQNALAGSLATQCSDVGAVLMSVSSVCACASSNSGQSITLNSVQSACQASAAAIPACALGLIADEAKSVGGCALYDFACQCSNSAAIQASVAGSIANVCTGSAGVNAVLQSVSSVCACVSSNGGSGGSSGGASGAASGGSAAASATSGSGSSAGGAAAGSGSGSSAPKATSAAGTSAPKATSAPAFSSFTGGAAAPAVGGFLAAVGGLVAML